MCNWCAFCMLAVLVCASRCCEGVEHGPGKSRGVVLMETMGVEAGRSSEEESRDLVNGIEVGAYRAKVHEPEQVEGFQKTAFDLVDKEGTIVFAGYCMKAKSADMARRALFEHLAMSSMPVELLAKQFEVEKGGVGELCVAERAYDAQEAAIVVVPYAKHVVQGGTAISMIAVDRKTSVADVLLGIVRLVSSDGASRVGQTQRTHHERDRTQ